MSNKTIKIELYDNYNSDKTATVVANLREGAAPWITDRQLKSAKRRAHMIGGSYLRASGDLIDLGYDSINVFDDNNQLVDVVMV